MVALAYHVVVHALEAKAGWTPARRFATAIQSVLDGHLPYERHLTAGLVRERAGTGQDTVEALVREQLAFDLNPLTQAARAAPTLEKLLHAYNDYNQSVELGARTSFPKEPNRLSQYRTHVQRQRIATDYDPQICQHATYFVFEQLIRAAMQNMRNSATQKLNRMSNVARLLGLDRGVIGETALAIESLGYVPIERIGRELGVSQRTLARRLHEDGLTAESLRLVDRLLRALDGIRVGQPLVEVAADAGFSDQAQMTRAFRASCGLTPGYLSKFFVR